MLNASYWKEQFEKLEETQSKKAYEFQQYTELQFKKAQKEIEDRITLWYVRLADNNDVSLTEARKLLTKDELKEFHWTLEEYIKNGKAGELTKELENASAKVHISRLESIQLQLQVECESLYGKLDAGLKSTLSNIYTDNYYHAAYEIQKGVKVGWKVNALSHDQVEKAITRCWTYDGDTFSDRVWKNKTKLLHELNNSLTQTLIQGKSPNALISDFAKKMDTSRKSAGRLIMTESAFTQSVSRKDCFKDLGVEEFEIVATLDSHTSDICQEMDGKHFKMSEYKVGETAPPFHCWCRSSTCPYFDDEFSNGGVRAARGADGKTYYVPADMTYKDWHKQYVESDPEELLKEKKLLNRDADQKQFNRYRDAMGEEYLPKTLDEFQNIKYTDNVEYGIMKAQNKGIGYYNKAIAGEPEITKTVKDISDKTEMECLGLEHRIKAKDSYLEKIRKNYTPDGNDYEVKDIVRYTFGSDAETAANNTLKSIEVFEQSGYNVSGIKNYWLNKQDPYNGINTIVQAPDGQKFEVQYHTAESYAVKDAMHKDYEKWRALDKSSKEAVEIRKRMLEQSKAMKVPNGIERVKGL